MQENKRCVHRAGFPRGRYTLVYKGLLVESILKNWGSNLDSSTGRRAIVKILNWQATGDYRLYAAGVFTLRSLAKGMSENLGAPREWEL